MQLGEDLLHVYPIYRESNDDNEDDERVLSISKLISRGNTSPTGLSSAEAEELATMFRDVPLPR